MGLLKPAVNTAAFVKFALYGTQGTGKTHTSTIMAIGLHNYIKSTKPVAFFDTETGSSFILELLKNEGIEVISFKGRAFLDLITVMIEAQESCDIIIIDSISHVWQEFKRAFLRSKKRDYMMMNDWDPLKEGWQKFTDLYVNSNVHIFLCARSSNVFEDEDVSVDYGSTYKKKKTKSIKVGTKMKAEGDLGYEANLLMEMTINYQAAGSGSDTVRSARVIKDRWRTLDSQTFNNPTFKDVLPHVKKLALGRHHEGVNTHRNSDMIFQQEGESDEYFHKRKRRELLVREIKDHIMYCFPSSTSLDKSCRMEVIDQIFQTPSFEKVATLTEDELKAGFDEIQIIKTNFNREDTPEPKKAKEYIAGLRKLHLTSEPSFLNLADIEPEVSTPEPLNDPPKESKKKGDKSK